MVGLIALTGCLLLIWQLFRLNRDKDVRTSAALWIPTFWFFIAASRNVSEWLQYSPGGGSNEYLEGSPLDRGVLTFVLALGVIVLLGRSNKVLMFLRSNLPIVIFFLYCGISVYWSDFPDVAFKRWFRAMGDVVMVLIVLTDPEWLVAIRRLLERVGFVLLPLSIVFIRYYPQLGRGYSRGGTPTWTGVATDKNALGMLSLLIGLECILRFLEIYRGKKESTRRGPLIAQGLVIAMACYLLWEARSATAFSCFFLAGGPMVLTYLFRGARRPLFVSLMIFGVLGVAISALFLNMGTGMLEDLGRNSTLTGRTEIWQNALSLVQNPLFGMGYESFWVGPRLLKMERLIDQTVNQAHNGYIEVFLNLGWMGIALLMVVLISAYRRVVNALRWMTPGANLRLAYFIVAVTYNFTEAGFKMMHPVWIAFLLVTMVVPEAPRPADSPRLDFRRANQRLPDLRLEPRRQSVEGVHREPLQRPH
jgi:exopolysaccharide production protein ExoQ